MKNVFTLMSVKMFLIPLETKGDVLNLQWLSKGQKRDLYELYIAFHIFLGDEQTFH